MLCHCRHARHFRSQALPFPSFPCAIGSLHVLCPRMRQRAKTSSARPHTLRVLVKRGDKRAFEEPIPAVFGSCRSCSILLAHFDRIHWRSNSIAWLVCKTFRPPCYTGRSNRLPTSCARLRSISIPATSMLCHYAMLVNVATRAVATCATDARASLAKLFARVANVTGRSALAFKRAMLTVS
jgi:hypothetical protein